ncbi:nucleotidyltransferase family protein [Pseudooceanicola nanhaiensis]|uniref:nucleotidyltransferase family protein n=1 Tax=Pseudooceanicola nanhaiensis TaxID=375761 RepID=UPI001CD1C707|nr:nucleotidyltransferase family protein [Pseudooceanicola nanhaiensis]MCA0920254.1 nucleotidyltransferase family protein [Pseudooceanicola nanhaiensis]
MRDTPDAVMMFAAGFGTRMKALTADRPKPLVEVGGRPLIDHALTLVREAGIGTVVANTHYRADQMATWLTPRGVRVSQEAPDILETGGGLRHALPLLGEGPVFTLNTDAIWSGPNPLALLRDAWDPARMDALLLCIPVERAVGHKGRGDFLTDAEGRITARGPGMTYLGAQILRTEGLAEIAEPAFSLNLLWDRMQAQGRLFALEYPGHWCDVGQPESIPLAEALLTDV